MNWTTLCSKRLREGGPDAQAGLKQWNAEFVGALGALVLRNSFEKNRRRLFSGKGVACKGTLHETRGLMNKKRINFAEKDCVKRQAPAKEPAGKRDQAGASISTTSTIRRLSCCYI